MRCAGAVIFLICSPCTRGLTDVMAKKRLQFDLFPVHTGINRDVGAGIEAR